MPTRIPWFLLTMVLLLTSGCLYTSPRCLFEKIEGRPVLSAYINFENQPGFSVTYRDDGSVGSCLNPSGYLCRRFDAEAQQQMMKIVEDPHVGLDRSVPFRDAMFDNLLGRIMVYVMIDDAKSGRTIAWWAPELEERAGHIELLDDVFCSLEGRLPAMRRYVEKYAPDFLAARGREAPCSESRNRS